MFTIIIKTIPHKEQRYNTCGDWQIQKEPFGDVLMINVSKMSCCKYEFLVVFHELVEAVLCIFSGITQRRVDKFDFAYEKKRKKGDQSEPGDSPKAPYRVQHCIATGVERILAGFLGVVWADYEKEINSL